MTTTPDGISFSDLQEFIKDAPKESQITKVEGPFKGLTQQQVEDLADRHLEEMNDECPHPIAHKVAAMKIIHNMLVWHTEAGKSIVEDGDKEGYLGWLRDAGKFQAIAIILSGIAICEDDFTAPE